MGDQLFLCILVLMSSRIPEWGISISFFKTSGTLMSKDNVEANVRFYLNRAKTGGQPCTMRATGQGHDGWSIVKSEFAYVNRCELRRRISYNLSEGQEGKTSTKPPNQLTKQRLQIILWHFLICAFLQNQENWRKLLGHVKLQDMFRWGLRLNLHSSCYEYIILLVNGRHQY